MPNSIAWAVNRWLLEEAGIAEDYNWTGGFSPFIPIRSNIEEPAIVYVERVTVDPQEVWQESSEISYFIHEPDYDKLTRIKNKIIRVTKNLDRSAYMFNKWLHKTDWDYAQEYIEQFNVFYLTFVVAPDVTPPQQQGESFQQLVRIKVDYARQEQFAL